MSPREFINQYFDQEYLERACTLFEKGDIEKAQAMYLALCTNTKNLPLKIKSMIALCECARILSHCLENINKSKRETHQVCKQYYEQAVMLAHKYDMLFKNPEIESELRSLMFSLVVHEAKLDNLSSQT